MDQILGRAVFFGYLGVILFATGRSMPKQVALRERLAPARVADVMRPPPATVPATISLAEALDHALRDDPEGVFPVVDAGRVVGTISMESARKVGSRDPLRPVRDGMLPLNRTTVVAPEDSLDDAFDWLAGKPALVLRDGVLVGALSPEDVERWYRSRYEGYRDDEPSTWAPLSGHGDDGSELHGPSDPPPRPDV
jgi:CBS domain-containing protein